MLSRILWPLYRIGFKKFILNPNENYILIYIKKSLSDGLYARYDGQDWHCYSQLLGKQWPAKACVDSDGEEIYCQPGRPNSKSCNNTEIIEGIKQNLLNSGYCEQQTLITTATVSTTTITTTTTMSIGEWLEWEAWSDCNSDSCLLGHSQRDRRCSADICPS